MNLEETEFRTGFEDVAKVLGFQTETGARLLAEIELWEVSLVTFPMLPDARIGQKSEERDDLADALFRELAAVVEEARRSLAGFD